MEVTQRTGPDVISLIMVIIALVGIILVFVGIFLFLRKYLVGWIKYKDREKSSLQFVLLQIKVPRGNEIKIDAAEQLFGTFASLSKSGGMFANFKPQPHLSFEIVASHEKIRFLRGRTGAADRQGSSATLVPLPSGRCDTGLG